MGRSQVGADQAQHLARAAGRIGAGTALRFREPGRRHVRRQRRLVPPGAARAVADGGTAGRLPDGSFRHREEPADPDRCAVEQQRTDRGVQRAPGSRVAGARRQLNQPRHHPRDAQPGTVRCPRLPAGQQLGADRPGGQAVSAHQAVRRPARRPGTASARHTERPRQLLQHLRPRPGHRHRAAVAAELREPGAVHLRRCLRGQLVRRQHQAGRDLPGADGAGAATDIDELSAASVPPDQHHHRL